MYDIAIIGAGVSGCAIARELSKFQLKTVLLEREMDVSMGASKANSAIVHAGYDCVPGSLMAKLNVMGAAMMEDLCKDMKVSYGRCGSMVLAFTDEDIHTIQHLFERGITNGVEQLRLLNGDQAREIEPVLSNAVIGALYAPTAAICSPYELTIALAENAIINGVELRMNFNVTKIERHTEGYTIHSPSDLVHAKYVINAAGVHADDISHMAKAEDYTIIPRKGEYILMDKAVDPKPYTVIFQPPTKMGKGVLVAPTVHGNMFAGPTAVNQADKLDESTTREGLDFIRESSKRSMPQIDFKASITQFAGIRATLEGEKDFYIEESKKAPGFIHIAGICSPGLSSAPAIAKHVSALLRKAGLTMKLKSNFIPQIQRKHIPFYNMSSAERDAAHAVNPLYGRVICRCESVTEAEIVDMIHSPVPALTVDAIKRRTRATMGRCQGGFCGPRILDILCRELGKEPHEIRKSDTSSWIVKGHLRDGGAQS